MTKTQNNHDCRDELNGIDLRATPARVAILRLLETVKKPVDVTTILTYLNQNKIPTDPATAFRIMNLFTKKGITTPIQLHEGKTRYELTSQNDHHHLVCEQCGRIEDISDCSIGILEKEIKRKKHFLVKRHSLEFFGLCTNCQK